jgi:cytochrome c
MRRWTIAALTVAMIVGLGYVHPFGNPRVVLARGRGILLRGADMPARTRAVLVGKCADCHSNETRWPIYARVAPASWLIERDIVEARKEMDLSHWEEMPPERQEMLKRKSSRKRRAGICLPCNILRCTGPQGFPRTMYRHC